MNYTYDDFKNDYSEEEAYVDNEDELSFLYTLDRAWNGDSEYQYILGECYFSSGYGVKTDRKKAEYWFARSAELGYPRSQCAFGDILDERGEKQKAFDLFIKAARQGNYYGQTRTGIAYYKGMGVDKNITEAKLWLIQGAKGGYGEAYYYLALCFKDEDEKQYLTALTEGVKLNNDGAYKELIDYYIAKPDYGRAYELYMLAAKRGKDWAKRFLNGG